MGSLSGFGEQYERPLTVEKAKRVLIIAGLAVNDEDARQKLPRMGWEVQVAKHTMGNWPNSVSHLQLQNVCGIYVLASSVWEAEDWATVFGERFGLNSDFKVENSHANATP